MAAKGSTQDLGKAAQERLERARIEQRYSTARIAIKWAGIAAAVYFVMEALKVYAGRDTSIIVNAALSLFANLNLTVAISLAGAATIWAIAERMLRRHKIEKMQGRIKELETRIDPRRTSSGLQPDGRTNPADLGRH